MCNVSIASGGVVRFTGTSDMIPRYDGKIAFHSRMGSVVYFPASYFVVL